ncbi:hypothetical protein EYR36_005871 [Pleurotus pulmonarius]|nr:hypothetical protein EYR36_005871 [Pleurotus pulmonarius]
MANTNENPETKEFDRLSQAGSDADSWDDASSSASTTSSLPRKISVVKKDEEIQESPIGGSGQRPTKPLPASKIRNLDSKMPSNVVPPIIHPANPSMLPVQAHVPRNSVVSPQRRLFVILEQACLEAYRVSSGGGKGRYSKGGEEQVKYTLLNCDDHQGILAKTGRDIADARPDITHQCLLTLLDSPLNKAGLLQVYIHTAKGVLIEVNPHVRIPRTFKRFSGLMVQLLHKLSIRGVNGPEKLLKVIKNPISDHLPANTFKITLSGDAPTVRLSNYLSSSVPQTHSIAVFVGAMARGKDDFADAYVDEKISISEYSLSASVACGKFCCALEELWDIVPIRLEEQATVTLNQVIMSTQIPQAASASPMPEGVTDPNYKPEPGRLGNLTVIQLNTLEKFKTELKNDKIFVEERMDDAFLLRYLRARKFDLVKAKEMLVNAEKWREEFGVDDIAQNFDFKEGSEVNKYYPQYYHKTDKDGRPVYIEQLGKLDVTALYRITSTERLLQRLVHEYEKNDHQRFPACAKQAGHPIETSCTILDLKNVSLSNFYRVKDYVMQASSVGQDRYPETMGKFYVINAPWAFTAVWSIIKGWLDEVTVAKISILGTSYQPDLLKQIPAENLPEEFGGKCKCPGGCGLLLGAYLNTHFFGLVSYQYASYHTAKFGDPVWINVTHFAEPEKLFDSVWPFTIAPIVIAFSGIVVHTFLGYCAYRSTSKLYLFIIILVPSLASFALGLSYGIKTITARILPGSPSSPFHAFHTAYHAAEFCTNALISAILAYVIFTAPSGFRPLEHVAKRVIHGTIQIGLLSTLFSFLCLVTYAALGSSSTYYAIFLLPLGRIYSNVRISCVTQQLLTNIVPILADDG